jgi:ribosome-binding protein aMBF1 (putative translation factor)
MATSTHTDLAILADYARLVETGHADKDLSDADRATTVALLREVISRLAGGPEVIATESALRHLFTVKGDSSDEAYSRAAEIIRNV